MKRILLSTFLVGMALSVPAHAQGKKVVTINPDGSVTVTDPEGGPAQQLPPPKINPRRQAPFVEALPPEEQAKMRAKVKPAAPDVPDKPVRDAAPQKPLREKIVTPEKPLAKKPSVPRPERKTVARPDVEQPAPVEKPRVRPGEEPDMTRGEPAAPDSIGRVDPKRMPEPPARRRGPLTPDDAKRIALDVGPPASGIDVYPADYNGRKVFQVVFRTEEGERYVLVDRKTGDIVKE